MTIDDDTDFDLLSPLDSLAGPARRITGARASALVDAALDRAALPEAPVVAPARPARSWMRVAMIAAAITVAGGAASAAVYVAATRRAEEPVAPAPAPAEPRRAVAPPVDDPPEVEEVIEEIEAPALEIKVPRRPDRSDADETPDDLLRMANERRRDKQWSAADRLYRKVMKRERAGQAVYVATLASASIHLDHLDDAAGALRLYRRALKALPRGPLAAEARWGVAEAQRALGNADAEAEAIRAFVEHHADSPLANRARARLRELDARAP